MVKILPPVREDDKMLAGLTYPFWFIVIPMVMFSSRRQEPFVQFHARQSLWLGLGSTGATVLGAFLCWGFFYVLPSGSVSGLLGVAAFAALWMLFLFLFFLFFFIGYRASTGEFLMLPLVGKGALQHTMDDLGLSTADLEETGPPVRLAAPVAQVLEAAIPPPGLTDLRPPSSVRTGPAMRPLPRAASETRKSWEPSATKPSVAKPDPTNVLKRWLTDEEAQG